MSDRIVKVNELLKQIVADALNHEVETRGFLTVKAVETTPDMRHATVWISILGDEEEVILGKIKDQKRNIQKSVNKKISAKNVPALDFLVDYSGEYAQHIDELLKR